MFFMALFFAGTSRLEHSVLGREATSVWSVSSVPSAEKVNILSAGREEMFIGTSSLIAKHGREEWIWSGEPIYL